MRTTDMLTPGTEIHFYTQTGKVLGRVHRAHALGDQPPLPGFYIDYATFRENFSHLHIRHVLWISYELSGGAHVFLVALELEDGSYVDFQGHPLYVSPATGVN